MDDIPEKAIQSQILGILRYNGFYVQRMNSGGMTSTHTYKRGIRKGLTGRRFIKANAPGTPDIMAFKIINGKTELYFIEVKRPGKSPTMLQDLKMQELTDHGAHCFVATSIKDVTKNIPSVVF